MHHFIVADFPGQTLGWVVHRGTGIAPKRHGVAAIHVTGIALRMLEQDPRERVLFP